MSVLIVSLPGDAHALSVRWGLEKYGTPVRIVSGSDFPQLYSINFRQTSKSELRLIDESGMSILDDVSAVWNHRTLKAVPHEQVSEIDHEAITLSSEISMSGALAILEQQAFMLNPTRAKYTYGNKLVQLKAAVECGFAVPRTLVSSHYESVVEFVEETKRCIVKPLKFMRWGDERKNATLYTARLTKETLGNLNRLSVSACPMIYQEEIQKSYEYRVVVFGMEITAYKLKSQKISGAEVDWRAVPAENLGIEVVELSETVRASIQKFMTLCGFVSGSFDLAVTNDEQVIFFEFNETGQFLWLEDINPTVPLLDMFCQYLTYGKSDFTYSRPAVPLEFAAWKQNARAHIEHGRARHVPVDMDRRFFESFAA